MAWGVAQKRPGLQLGVEAEGFSCARLPRGRLDKTERDTVPGTLLSEQIRWS